VGARVRACVDPTRSVRRRWSAVITRRRSRRTKDDDDDLDDLDDGLHPSIDRFIGTGGGRRRRRLVQTISSHHLKRRRALVEGEEACLLALTAGFFILRESCSEGDAEDAGEAFARASGHRTGETDRASSVASFVRSRRAVTDK